MLVRIGIGYDAHRFGDVRAGKGIMLGCVEVPFEREVVSHSDGDVIVHALCDAIFGAAALGDIGLHFPDTDPRWRGVPGESLLDYCYARVLERGLSLGNADITLIAERPRVRDYVTAMRAAVAGVMEVEVDRVSIKATTTEKMGFIGREEGLAAQAVVLLV
jgi:2-C-methyl-D-erythritol 2,4-cyclodiphosphate synthase